MQMEITVKTAKGYYASTTLSCRMLQPGLNLVLPTLENLPEEIDGVKQVDWTEISITFTRPSPR